MSYPGEAPALRRLGLPGAVENRTANGDPVAGKGQGVTDPRRVADDSGPMKPGNSVEDNPLTTENPRTDGTGNGAMVALNGHEAGNGGHCQEATYRPPRRSRPEGKLGRPAVAGGTWEAVDERRE